MSKRHLYHKALCPRCRWCPLRLTGNADGWFDAGEPLAPVAQQAEGRRFDYEPFYNVGHSKPREREAIGFTQLRALADNYDVLRLVIETRKDQMGA